jgi:hypothetical protein
MSGTPLGSLRRPMMHSNSPASEIEPRVDIFFMLKAGWRRRSHAQTGITDTVKFGFRYAPVWTSR